MLEGTVNLWQRYWRVLSNKLHGGSLGKMPERAIFDTELAGEEENGALTRTKVLEKFDAGEDKDTAEKCVVDRFRLRRCCFHGWTAISDRGRDIKVLLRNSLSVPRVVDGKMARWQPFLASMYHIMVNNNSPIHQGR